MNLRHWCEPLCCPVLLVQIRWSPAVESKARWLQPARWRRRPTMASGSLRSGEPASLKVSARVGSGVTLQTFAFIRRGTNIRWRGLAILHEKRRLGPSFSTDVKMQVNFSCSSLEQNCCCHRFLMSERSLRICDYLLRCLLFFWGACLC